MCALSALKELDLSFNSWSQGGPGALAALCRCTQLTKLDLHSCGLARVPEALAALRSLADLNLNSK